VRIVLDTNVLVSGVLGTTGPPARLVDGVLEGELELVFDVRILAEYEDVLRRPELALPRPAVGRLVASLERFGLEVVLPPWPVHLPDPDDEAFLAAAFALGCPLVTGNLRHFPASARQGVEVLSPRDFLERWRAGRA